MAEGAKGRKGKIGKKKSWISAYFANGQHHFNKARRLTKHLRKFPMDQCALTALSVAKACMPAGATRRYKALYEKES